VTYAHLEAGTHTFAVALAGTTIGTATRQFNVDSSAPTVRLYAFHPTLTRSATATSHWSATDPAGVGVYQLRVKRTLRGTPMPEWSRREPTTATSATLHLDPNTWMCVSVRAKDSVGNLSRWTTAQCVVRDRRQ
jgi:hypothetical protein